MCTLKTGIFRFFVSKTTNSVPTSARRQVKGKHALQTHVRCTKTLTTVFTIARWSSRSLDQGNAPNLGIACSVYWQFRCSKSSWLSTKAGLGDPHPVFPPRDAVKPPSLLFLHWTHCWSPRSVQQPYISLTPGCLYCHLQSTRCFLGEINETEGC